MRLSLVQDLKPKAVEFMENTTVAVGVSDVAKHLGVAWSTVRQILFELMLEGKVDCEKTTNSRIFRARKHSAPIRPSE